MKFGIDTTSFYVCVIILTFYTHTAVTIIEIRVKVYILYCPTEINSVLINNFIIVKLDEKSIFINFFFNFL